MKNCRKCGKTIAENQETLSREGITYHVKCAPRIDVFKLLAEVEAYSFDLGIEFRICGAFRNDCAWIEIRVVKDGIRLSSRIARTIFDAYDAAVEPYRSGRISEGDILAIVANGGHGIDCPICEGREHGPESRVYGGRRET